MPFRLDTLSGKSCVDHSGNLKALHPITKKISVIMIDADLVLIIKANFFCPCHRAVRFIIKPMPKGMAIPDSK
jgi:hypothetical protein